MAHEHVQSFSVNKPTWHGLATILDHYPGREEGMRIAGHDFTVIERPLYIAGSPSQAVATEAFEDDKSYVVTPDGNFGAKGADGWKALLKSGTGDILNIVQNSYTVVQNDELWDIVDFVVEQPNVMYETAGILRLGAVLWVLAKIDEPSMIKGDNSEIYPYICVSTTHDGSGACRADATSVRVVCMNTFNGASAEAKRSGRSFTFRHTKNVKNKIEDAKLALKGVGEQHQAFMALAEELAEVKLTRNQRELFVTQFVPMPPEAMISKRVMTNVENARTKVRGIFDSATTAEAHQFTGFGAFQAGIEYLDHLRGTKGNAAESMFNRSILKPEPAKQKLAGLIRECAKA